MKITIEIEDDLLERAKRAARERKTTFRALVEQGLSLVLPERKAKATKMKWQPLVVFGRDGLSEEFKDYNWEKIRNEIYRERGS